ncbi:hypothetical protein [Streptomyces flavidovirens]|uniref:Uncharacterized protein n=1 Tax=Streptomyces flavidovirens TaxID=67298 RepID=A0ABW6R913_9ACTN
MADDKPETPGQRMNRLIRETPARVTRDALRDNFRRTWAKPTKKENHDG